MVLNESGVGGAHATGTEEEVYWLFKRIIRWKWLKTLVKKDRLAQKDNGVWEYNILLSIAYKGVSFSQLHPASRKQMLKGCLTPSQDFIIGIPFL